MLHTDIDYVSFRLDAVKAMSAVLYLLYRDVPTPTSPLSLKIQEKKERNAAIRQRFYEGESLTELAHAYSISEQRVHQIVYGYS